MDNSGENRSPVGSAAEFQDILSALGAARFPAAALAVRALAELHRGVMTGEGPTTRGRVHFSRTIDAEDTALCEWILVAAGGEAGGPVSREETEILLEIHETALEREDDGRFDELFAKAIAHHVLASAGRSVPPRRLALAAATPLAAWASPAELAVVDREVAAWIAGRPGRKRRSAAALEPVAAMLIGAGALPFAISVADALDWAM